MEIETVEATKTIGLGLASALMFLGTVVHFVLTLADLEDKGQHYTPYGYLKLHPWRALSLVMCAWLALYVSFAMGECTRVAAVLIGFSCQTAADRLRARANAKASK
jgi:hypothetical protein